MNNHVQAIIDEGIKSSEMREKAIKDEIWKTIEISRNLRKNIGNIQEMVDKKMETVDINNKEDVNLLMKLIGEARLLYDQLLKYEKVLDIKENIDVDSIYDKVISCMIEAGIPDEFLYKFNMEWKKRI